MSLVIVPPASATAISTAPPTGSPATTTEALFLRTRFVDLERSAPDFFSVESRDRFFGFIRIRHFYESEASRTSGLPIGHYAHPLNRSMRFEQRSKFGFCRAVGKVSYKQVLHDVSLSLSFCV
jgi:hypothetical protein